MNDRTNHGSRSMSGFKADLRLVCRCPVYIVGKTEADLLANLRRHAMDVHATARISNQDLKKLRQATKKL